MPACWHLVCRAGLSWKIAQGCPETLERGGQHFCAPSALKAPCAQSNAAVPPCPSHRLRSFALFRVLRWLAVLGCGARMLCWQPGFLVSAGGGRVWA